MLVGLRLVALVGAPVWVFAGAWLVGTKAGAVLTSGRPRARSRSRSGPDDAAPAPADPFRTLALQRRLTALATEIDLLVADAEGVYARGVRLHAVTSAYDDVLADACALAGVPVQRDRTIRREVGRLMEEAGLRSAGWTW